MIPDEFLMQFPLHTEFAARSMCHRSETICGDNYILRRSPSGNRTLAVVSDGLGHGVKASVLSNLTSTMLANFVGAGTDARHIAGMLDAMLPVDRNTDISYATFTLADVDNTTGDVTLMQYDNPGAFVVRDGVVVPLEWSEPYAPDIVGRRPGKLVTAKFRARPGDRLVMATDGVTQSGQKSGMYRFGWGIAELEQYCCFLLNYNGGIGSADLAAQVVSKSFANDGRSPLDDMTCAVMTFREPRRLMLVSCPPALAVDNPRMAEDVLGFEGEKIVCGEPVASLIADHAGERLEYDERYHARSEFPVYRLPGFDLVTDGMIVPGRVLEILEHSDGAVAGNDIPDRVARMLLRNDSLHFRVGMRRNIDPRGRIPDEFSVRRNILRRIISLLEKKYEKRVETVYY